MDEARFAALEARLRAAEDQLEIIRLIATYGPAADSGEGRKAASIWTEDGVYDAGSLAPLRGQDAIAVMFDGPVHQKLMHQGSGHVLTTPKITLHGDTAEAQCHSFVLLKGDDGWDIWRAAANAWKLERTHQGWRVVERLNRLLDGSEESHDTFRKGVRPRYSADGE